jgi:hypothetical protein
VQDVNDHENKTNDQRKYLAKGTMFRFGTERIHQFSNKNNLSMIIRSHECVMNGVESFGQTHLYTVFSCTNYGGTSNNSAGILLFHRTKQLKTKQLSPKQGSTHWWDMNKLQKINYGNRGGFNPKDRPVTPPRPVYKNQRKF